MLKKRMLDMIPKRASERISIKVHQREAEERQQEFERLKKEEEKAKEAEEQRVQMEIEKKKAREMRALEREKIAEGRSINYQC